MTMRTLHNTRTYTDLLKYDTIEDRFKYLCLNGSIGEATFGYDRWLNQKFYTSDEWRRVRDEIILRDNGCELGLEGFEIKGKVLIHHMNPIDKSDIVKTTEWLLNPEYLICVSYAMHNAIHYSGKLPYGVIIPERRPGDTCPWRR